MNVSQMRNGFIKEIGGLAGAGSERGAIDSAVIASIKHAANFPMTPLLLLLLLLGSGSGPESVSDALQPLLIRPSALPLKLGRLLSLKRKQISALPPGGGGRHLEARAEVR